MTDFNALDERGILELLAAIDKQAMRDYETALREGEKDKAKALERWFLSEWGQQLTLNHGEIIIEQCKKKVAAQPKRARRRRKK